MELLAHQVTGQTFKTEQLSNGLPHLCFVWIMADGLFHCNLCSSYSSSLEEEETKKKWWTKSRLPRCQFATLAMSLGDIGIFLARAVLKNGCCARASAQNNKWVLKSVQNPSIIIGAYIGTHYCSSLIVCVQRLSYFCSLVMLQWVQYLLLHRFGMCPQENLSLSSTIHANTTETETKLSSSMTVYEWRRWK